MLCHIFVSLSVELATAIPWLPSSAPLSSVRWTGEVQPCLGILQYRRLKEVQPPYQHGPQVFNCALKQVLL